MADRGAGVKHFSYTKDILDERKASFSSERLDTCLHAAQGGRDKACNTEGSAPHPTGRCRGSKWPCATRCAAGLPTDTEKPGTAMATQVSTGVQVRELPGPERSLRVMAKGGGDPYRNRCGAVFRVLGPGGRLGDGCKANCRMTLWRPALRQSESQAGPPAHERLADVAEQDRSSRANFCARSLRSDNSRTRSLEVGGGRLLS